MPDLEQTKRVVLECYEPAFNQGRPEEAASRYIGSGYIQRSNPAEHNWTKPA